MRNSVRDPVCGKEIVLTDVIACEDHNGWAYFFCSAGCLEAFTADPARFAESRQRPTDSCDGA